MEEYQLENEEREAVNIENSNKNKTGEDTIMSSEEKNTIKKRWKPN